MPVTHITREKTNEATHRVLPPETGTGVECSQLKWRPHFGKGGPGTPDAISVYSAASTTANFVHHGLSDVDRIPVMVLTPDSEIPINAPHPP